METFHARTVATLMEAYAPAEEGDASIHIDAEELTSACIVKLTKKFADLNFFIWSIKGKRITDARRGVIFDHLAGIMNLVQILYHVTDTEVPEEEDIVGFSEEFPQDYANDAILNSMNSLASLCQITETIYDSEIGSDGYITAEEAQEDIEQGLAEIYAGAIVLSQQYEIDFGEVMEYSVDRKEWM